MLNSCSLTVQRAFDSGCKDALEFKRPFFSMAKTLPTSKRMTKWHILYSDFVNSERKLKIKLLVVVFSGIGGKIQVLEEWYDRMNF